MTHDQSFVDDIIQVVGHDHVLRSNQLSMRDPGVDEDNLSAGLAARPANADEVSALLRICSRAGVSVVCQGGRTGLARGAVSEPGQLLLLTERLLQLEIHADERVARVGAGVTLQNLQEAAAEHGLSPGIDLAARGSATVGGMVSTNAGGMEAFRFGMMRQRLLGMEAVLANGDVLSDLARVSKNNEGYDLHQLFCGSEGTLGVVTQVTIRLEKCDPPAQTVLVACKDATDTTRVMRAFHDKGSLLLAEIMWKPYAHSVASACNLETVIGFCDSPVYAIFDVAGDEDNAVETLAPLMEDGTVSDAVLAKSDRESADIWRIREDSFAINRNVAQVFWFDVSVPLPAFDAYLDGLKARLSDLGGDLVVYAMGHLADGNLHVTVTSDVVCSQRLSDAVYRAVEFGLKDQGGSISAEHGIGLAKLASLSRNISPAKLALMRTLKATLDPGNILNPGKVVPGSQHAQ